MENEYNSEFWIKKFHYWQTVMETSKNHKTKYTPIILKSEFNTFNTKNQYRKMSTNSEIWSYTFKTKKQK